MRTSDTRDRMLKRYLLNNKGFSLIELVVVLVIAAILIVAGGIAIKPTLAKRNVRDCGSNMIADIQLIRSHAQSDGRRAIFQLSSVAKAEDIDGDGLSEYYIGFLDINSNGAHDAGDTVLIHGTGGDELCSSRVSIDNQTLNAAGTIAFDPLGMVMTGAVNANIYLKADETATRVELVSLAGMLRSYVNMDNCGGNACDTTDNWEPLR